MKRIGPYEAIEPPLGIGVTSVVYRAIDPSMKRTVALKVLLEHLLAHPEDVERFRREAENVAGLRHPNIVTVHYASLHEPPYFMAFEFLSGGTLADRISRPMPIDQALAIIRPICSAVDEAHQHHVIHRDIKPGNIMFDETGKPVLTDFGIALADNQTRLTMVGVKRGTADYMSPEQADGRKPLDWRTDMYSLAAVVYHMLTGRPPFQDPDAFTVLRRIMNDPVPAPSTVNAAIPQAVDRVLLRALNKKPERRYQSAGEFCRALAAIAEPPPASDETQKWRGGRRSGEARPRNERNVWPPRPRTALLMGLLVVVAMGIGLVLRALTAPGGGLPPPPPPPAVVMPSLSARYWPDAVDALRKWNHDVRVVRKTDPSAPDKKNRFIRTEPAAGRPVSANTVTVVIGSGPTLDNRYYERLYAAENAQRRKDYQGALMLTRALISDYGEDATLLNTQAVSYYRLGDMAAARAVVELAVRCDSDCAESWGTLAVIALRGGDPKRAKEAADAVYNCSVSRQTPAAKNAANRVKYRLAERWEGR